MLGELCEMLSEKYNLEELLEGNLDIDEILSDLDTVKFLSCSQYRAEDIEEYILNNIL